MRGITYGRATATNRALEYFVVFSVVLVIVSVSFISLERVLAGSRDAQRLGDIATIRQALELYYIDHNTYPETGWVTSGDDSWGVLERALAPYLPVLPVDPINEAGGVVQRDGAYTYAYYSTDTYGAIGGASDYIIVFRTERPNELTLYQRATTTISSRHSTFHLRDLTGVEGVFAVRSPR